jgi:hypothetical protein
LPASFSEGGNFLTKVNFLFSGLSFFIASKDGGRLWMGGVVTKGVRKKGQGGEKNGRRTRPERNFQ